MTRESRIDIAKRRALREGKREKAAKSERYREDQLKTLSKRNTRARGAHERRETGVFRLRLESGPKLKEI